MGVQKYDQKNRPKPYGVKWLVDGKRKFKFFRTQAERNEFFRNMRKQEANEGKSILNISAKDAAIMMECIQLLGESSTVLQACKEYHGRKSVRPIKTAHAVREYLNEKARLGRDENYIRAHRNILQRMIESRELHKPLTDWIPEDAKNWAMHLTASFAAVTVRNHIKSGLTFCNWAIKNQYLAENPFIDVPVPDVIMPEPDFLNVAAMQRMMEVAQEHYPDAVAYMALNAFAGIRSSACARLGVEAIKFEEKGILIPAAHAKNKRRIYVDGHPDNLWSWLQWARDHAPEGFELSKRLWDRRREQIYKKAKVKMPHNAFRHSFCSYHVALMGDAGRTATLLTQRGNVAILYEHYRGNVTKANAEKYFAIIPD